MEALQPCMKGVFTNCSQVEAEPGTAELISVRKVVPQSKFAEQFFSQIFVLLSSGGTCFFFINAYTNFVCYCVCCIVQCACIMYVNCCQSSAICYARQPYCATSD